MTRFPFRNFLTLTVLSVFVAASQAGALTADEVWADWQLRAEEAGAPITAATRREGDRLVVTGIEIPVGPVDDRDVLRLSRIDLQDRPDGTVALLLPPSFPIVVNKSLPREAGEIEVITLTASAPGFSMIIAGLGEQADYDLSAPSLVISLASVVPALGPGESADFNLALADFALRHRMDLTAPTQTVASTLRLGTLHFDAKVDIPGDKQTFAFTIDLAAVAAAFDAVIPPSAQRQPEPGEEPTIAALLTTMSDGLSIGASLSHDGISVKVDGQTEAELPFALEVSSASLKGATKLDRDVFDYDLTIGRTALKTTVDDPEIGVPEIEMSVAEYSGRLSFGIGNLTDPQEARLTFRLIDLTLPPAIWAEVDPTGLFPATPISFAIDLTGGYALGPEMLEPGWEPQPDVFPPMDIVGLTLQELLVSGFGVTVKGDGTLTFDESDLTTFAGVPAPEGRIGLEATGVYSLIDRVAEAGLVPPEQLTPLRLGLAFIGKAGEAPDSLVSAIEFRDKSFYLNGQKLR
ncbi:MAG: DUF2125 domain-containing protein [Tabrizicola sp.]|nr:DUF2125 domain-containing protein [Tabrizicola sp.]